MYYLCCWAINWFHFNPVYFDALRCRIVGSSYNRSVCPISVSLASFLVSKTLRKFPVACKSTIGRPMILSRVKIVNWLVLLIVVAWLIDCCYLRSLIVHHTSLFEHVEPHLKYLSYIEYNMRLIHLSLKFYKHWF